MHSRNDTIHRYAGHGYEDAPHDVKVEALWSDVNDVCGNVPLQEALHETGGKGYASIGSHRQGYRVRAQRTFTPGRAVVTVESSRVHGC